jgi:GT2 family glycosyltransferase
LLIWAPIVKRRGMKRQGFKLWRSIDDDPQIFIAPKLLRSKFVVIDLYSHDSQLDPCLYLDEGKGFDPEQEIVLNPANAAIYIINISDNNALRKIRFDPATFPSEFEVSIFTGYNELDISSYVARKLKRTRAVEAQHQIICQTIDLGSNAPLKPTKKTVSPQSFFDHTIALAAMKYSGLAEKPLKDLISFITPVYNASPEHLDQLVKSLTSQAHEVWELILSDDGSTSKDTLEWLDHHKPLPSIKILRNNRNEGIAAASNRGLSVARGNWVGLIDHDDALAPFSLHTFIDTIKKHPLAQLIYTDEVITNNSLQPKGYFLKPAFDPILLSGVNYINHLTLYRNNRLQEIGGFREGFDGSQDYDLLLRYLRGLKTSEIIHLPYPAYLWRRHDASLTSQSLHVATEKARNSLKDLYSHKDEEIEIDEALDKTLHRVRFDKLEREWPGVSIVIPSINSFNLISRILDGLNNNTDYPNLEIIIQDNGTTENNVLELYGLQKNINMNFSVEIIHEKFNFSKSINRGMQRAKRDYVLLLNNDIEIIDRNWLKEMVSCFDYAEVGIVGARLLYPNSRLQHAGVIVGLGNVAGHWFCGATLNQPGPMNRLKVRQSFSAVTGACMLISRACIEAVGAFDEENFAIAYNDIDFCLRASQKGFRVMWTPFATLYHYESATRGSDETKNNIDRFNQEKLNLRTKYALTDFIDPAFSPWYTKTHANPRLTILSKLPESRMFFSVPK